MRKVRRATRSIASFPLSSKLAWVATAKAHPRLVSGERSPLASCAIIASGIRRSGGRECISSSRARPAISAGQWRRGSLQTATGSSASRGRRKRPGRSPPGGSRRSPVPWSISGPSGRPPQAADAVINAASADDSMVAHVLVQSLEGSGKPLLHTSGTSVAADRALGERSDVVFTEDLPLQTLPERLLRVEVERSVLGAAGRGVRSVVIRPALLYGRGLGLNPHSHQLPQLARITVARGRPAHVGRGLNVWSHLHIDDLAQLYLRTLADAPPGSLYFAESGEASWRDMAIGIGRAVGLSGEPEALPTEEALRLLGIGAVTSFGSNSRVSAEKARRMLDWKPAAPSLWDDLGTDYYKTSFARVEEG